MNDHPLYLPAATHSYLERAAASLQEAITSTDVPERYAHAHVAALRATAALLAARARPATGRARRQKNAWVLLAEVAPELAEWATFFAAGAAKRAAAEAGSRQAVSEREADDLIRDADRFLHLIEKCLGLSPAWERSARSSDKADERRRGRATSSEENAVGGRAVRSA